MVVANEPRGRTAADGSRPGLITHVGCSVAGAALTLGFLLVVGVGSLFAVLSVLGYLSTTVFVWLVLVWWVVWWLAAEVLVHQISGRPTGSSN